MPFFACKDRNAKKGKTCMFYFKNNTKKIKMHVQFENSRNKKAKIHF